MFTSILVDTVVNDYLAKFISILIKHLDAVEITKTGENIKDRVESSRFTSFKAYFTFPRVPLTRTAAIADLNLKINN